jgi:hypothetical protein
VAKPQIYNRSEAEVAAIVRFAKTSKARFLVMY